MDISEKGHLYKKETSQLINAKSPDATVKSGSVVVSNNRVAQNKTSVNSNSTQGDEKYSEGATENGEEQYSLLSGVDNLGEGGYNTRYGEDLKSTPKYLMPTPNREWQTFTRSFANKTNDIKSGDTKVVTVFTADNRYLILADGYMSGVIYDKVDLNDVNEMEKFIDDYRPSKVFSGTKAGNGNRQGNDTDGISTPPFARTSDYFDELDAFIESHPEFFRDRRESYRDFKKRTADLTDESAFSMPESKQYSISVEVEEEYMSAVESGQETEMQRLVDIAAEAAMPDSAVRIRI